MNEINVIQSFIKLHNPHENGIIERWNGTLENELNFNKTKNKEEAILLTKEWIYNYNNIRRHSSLSFKSHLKWTKPIGKKINSNQATSITRNYFLSRKFEFGYLDPIRVILNFEKK